MKLGLLTAPFADTSLGAVSDWASSAGFEALEIACWPKSSGAARRYAGTSHIDAASTSAAQAKEIAAALAEKKLSISGLGFYPNPLHPDAAGGSGPMTSSTTSPCRTGVRGRKI